MADNKLYYGDNLDVIRRHVKDESVDLVYLDPPFNSNADYNVLFARKDGTQASAQIQAFEDTWRWDLVAARSLDEMVRQGGPVGDALLALQRILGESDMMAYLAMMAPRLVEFRRVLKETGSIYLHCDPTASHYLKVLLDAAFGPENFRNEIVWERTFAKALMTRRLPTNHDIILAYQRSEDAYWNNAAAFIPYEPENLDEKTASKYRHRDGDGRLYRLDNLLNPNKNRPNLDYEFMGVRRVWRWTKERMEKARRDGRIVQTKPGRVPQLKRYLDEQRGRPFGDVWTDIPPLNSQAQERLGYPTQKPVALLERIISVGSQEGDVVLDPFCGCGTTIAAAHRLHRKWIGIDITHLAVNLMKHRLQDTYGPSVVNEYDVVGEPTTVEGAVSLAESDPYQFQFWALGLVGARPQEEKKGADHGIDGRLHFKDPATSKYETLIISVKAGKPKVPHMRDLRGVVDREKAAIGVLILMQEPTGPMKKEAATGGFYSSPFGEHPRLQIITVGDLIDGKRIDYPRQADVTLKRAKRDPRKDSEQLDLAASDE